MMETTIILPDSYGSGIQKNEAGPPSPIRAARTINASPWKVTGAQLFQRSQQLQEELMAAPRGLAQKPSLKSALANVFTHLLTTVPACASLTGAASTSATTVADVGNAVGGMLGAVGNFIQSHDFLRLPGAAAASIASPAPPWQQVAEHTHDAALAAADDSSELNTSQHTGKDAYVLKLLGLQQQDHINPVQLVNATVKFCIGNPDATQTLARKIQLGTGAYGSHRHEHLSPRIQNFIVRRWLEEKIFDQGIGAFIQQQQQQALALKEPMTNAKLRYLVLHASMLGASTLEHEVKDWLFAHVVKPALPTLAYDSEQDLHQVEHVRLDDFEWGQVHAGLQFMQFIGHTNQDISPSEARELGINLLAQLHHQSIPASWSSFFDLPAQFRKIASSPDRLADKNADERQEWQARALLDYVTDYRQWLTDADPVLHFLQKLEHYMTRREMAERELSRSDCYRSDLLSYLTLGSVLCHDGTSDAYGDVSPAIHLSDSYGVESLMALPLHVYLEDINEKFEEQNRQISDAYAKVDRMWLALAFESLAEDERSFAVSANIRLAQAFFSLMDNIRHSNLIGNPYARNRLLVDVNEDVDFLSATNEGEERIYALIRDRENAYTVRRVDRDEDKYLALLRADTRPQTDQNRRLIITALDTLLKKPGEPLVDHFFDSIAAIHKKSFFRSLHRSGYEQTMPEAIAEFLGTLLPVYSCIKAIHDEEPTGQIVQTCMTDLISLAPVMIAPMMRFAKTSLKISTSTYKSTLLAIDAAALERTLRLAMRTGANTFVQHSSLPASAYLSKQELTAWTKYAGRALLPIEIELGFHVGKKALQQMSKLAQHVATHRDHLSTVLPKIERAVAHVAKEVPVDSYTFARLPGIERDIPVLRMAGGKSDGKDIYVQIIPESGELFGRKYTLADSNMLVPVPIPVAQRLVNMRHQGLGGVGAIKGGQRMAQSETIRLQPHHSRQSASPVDRVYAYEPIQAENLNRWLTLSLDERNLYALRGIAHRENLDFRPWLSINEDLKCWDALSLVQRKQVAVPQFLQQRKIDTHDWATAMPLLEQWKTLTLNKRNRLSAEGFAVHFKLNPHVWSRLVSANGSPASFLPAAQRTILVDARVTNPIRLADITEWMEMTQMQRNKITLRNFCEQRNLAPGSFSRLVHLDGKLTPIGVARISMPARSSMRESARMDDFPKLYGGTREFDTGPIKGEHLRKWAELKAQNPPLFEQFCELEDISKRHANMIKTLHETSATEEQTADVFNTMAQQGVIQTIAQDMSRKIRAFNNMGRFQQYNTVIAGFARKERLDPQSWALLVSDIDRPRNNVLAPPVQPPANPVGVQAIQIATAVPLPDGQLAPAAPAAPPAQIAPPHHIDQLLSSGSRPAQPKQPLLPPPLLTGEFAEITAAHLEQWQRLPTQRRLQLSVDGLAYQNGIDPAVWNSVKTELQIWESMSPEQQLSVTMDSFARAHNLDPTAWAQILQWKTTWETLTPVVRNDLALLGFSRQWNIDPERFAKLLPGQAARQATSS